MTARSPQPHHAAYHHGDLRRALLDRAAVVVVERGVDAISFRGLAADLGVSHTAPAHHFGSRAGLLSAFAAEGHTLLAEALEAAGEDDFLELGIAYVRFALEHPGHFAVMFDRDALDDAHEELRAARARSFGRLRAGVDRFDRTADRREAAATTIAAWGMMHGIASLALGGELDAAELRDVVEDGDVLAIARRAARHLSPPSRRRDS